MQGVESYLGWLRQVDTPELIKPKLQEVVQYLGFDGFAYYVLRPPAGVSHPGNFHTYPEAWLDHYYGSGYPDDDAIFQAAPTSLLPYSWHGLVSDRRMGRRQHQIFDEAREFGINDGVTIPLHGPEGGLATLSLSTTRPSEEIDEIWSAHQSELALVGLYTHETILRWAQHVSAYTPIRLSHRERECLLWTARGKTTWEVAKILSVSDETVRFHLKNVMHKLDVYSKHHAVVKAIMLGLIVP